MMTIPRHSRLARCGPLIPLTVTLLLYMAFRSISLDDFDSYSFALALERFDLRLQQPQPPGFPVYVAMARLLQRRIHSPTLTLTTLSAISGALSVGVVGLLGYHTGAGKFGRTNCFTGALAALLFGLAPVTWLTSGKALSDMPGLLWTLLSLWLWILWRTRPDYRPPYLAALVTGIGLGVRPQNALPIAMWVIGTLLTDLVRRRSMRPWLIGAAFGILGILVWLVPLVQIMGGVSDYMNSVRAHAAHVSRADSLAGMLSTSASLAVALRGRAMALLDTLLIALISDGIQPPSGPVSLWRVLALAGVVVPGVLLANWRARATHHLALWFVAVVAQTFFFETLDRPRLFLPLVPPLALLVAAGWSRIRSPRFLQMAVLALVPLGLVLQSLPHVASLSQIPAPPSQATAYIQAHYPSGETLVAAAGSFRAAQVELADYPLAYMYRFDAGQVEQRFDLGLQYVAILDRDQFSPVALHTLTRQGSWITLEDLTFTRDRRVHTQHDQVRLQVLTSPDRVPTSALLLPEDGCIDIGSDEDGRYLGQGWFRPEEVGGVVGRWGGQTITSTVRFSLIQSTDLTLRMRALAFPANQRVAVRVNGSLVGTLDQAQDWTEMTISLPHSVLATAQPAVLELIHDNLTAPATVAGSGSSDMREISSAYDWLCLNPEGTPAP